MALCAGGAGRPPAGLQGSNPAGVRGSLRFSTLGVPSNIAQKHGLSDAVRVTLQMRSLNLSTYFCQWTASVYLPNSARAIKWCVVRFTPSRPRKNWRWTPSSTLVIVLLASWCQNHTSQP